jgi:hypothetical protein
VFLEINSMLINLLSDYFGQVLAPSLRVCVGVCVSVCVCKKDGHSCSEKCPLISPSLPYTDRCRMDPELTTRLSLLKSTQ